MAVRAPCSRNPHLAMAKWRCMLGRQPPSRGVSLLVALLFLAGCTAANGVHWNGQGTPGQSTKKEMTLHCGEGAHVEASLSSLRAGGANLLLSDAAHEVALDLVLDKASPKASLSAVGHAGDWTAQLWLQGLDGAYDVVVRC